MRVERKLLVRDGDNVRDVLLVGTVTVGRSPSCEISAADPRLSRAHAAFDVLGDEVVVRDLESRNGTRVNGVRVTEARLVAGDTVEVGPFVMELVETATAPVVVSTDSPTGANAATVLLPPGAPRGFEMPAAPAPVDPASPGSAPAVSASPAPAGDEGPDAPTRRMQRPPMPAAPVVPVAMPPPVPVAAVPAPAPDAATAVAASRPSVPPPAAATPAATPASKQAAPATAVATASASGAVVPPPAPPGPAVAGTRATTAPELTFARTTLLWVVPVALVSFLAGLVPDLLQPDQRTPLLQAHYGALAVSAAELVRTSREPAQPLDSITSALRRHTSVTGARVIGADGRVLAPLNEAGTSVTVPALAGAEPRVVAADHGLVDLYVPATTGDGRAVVAALVVDPAKIHPAPPSSAIATPLLLLCLGAAWMAARQLTAIADARLSRLGEEVELMTTRQVSAGRDPFSLRGGSRVLDAVTFALSPAGRRPGDAPATATRIEAPVTGEGAAATSAAIDTDAGFRVVRADAGCAALLGMAPGSAVGQHLIDVLQDQGVADEVLRLVTLATPERAAQGSALPAGRGFRLAIDVTRGSDDESLSIRFMKV